MKTSSDHTIKMRAGCSPVSQAQKSHRPEQRKPVMHWRKKQTLVVILIFAVFLLMGLFMFGLMFISQSADTSEGAVLLVIKSLLFSVIFGSLTSFIVFPILFAKEKALEGVNKLLAQGRLDSLTDMELVKNYEAARDVLDEQTLSDMIGILETRGLVEKDKVSLGASLFFADGNNSSYVFHASYALHIQLSQKMFLLSNGLTPYSDELIRISDISDARVWGEEYGATLHMRFRRKALIDKVKIDLNKKSVWVQTLRSQGINVTEGRNNNNA